MYLILGYGRTGKACDDFLKNKSIQTQIWDDQLGYQDPIDWDHVTTLIQSAGIAPSGPKSHPLVMEAQKRSIAIKSDIDLLVEYFPDIPIIAITGTNGKSTTTSLVAHLLKCLNIPHFAGANLGRPVLSLDPPENNEFFVLELSSYQLALSKPIPLLVGAITNITPDHLDWHGTMEDYVASKKKIFCLAQSKILMDDDEICQTMVTQDTVLVGEGEKSTYRIMEQSLWYGKDFIAPIANHPMLVGKHNEKNIALASSIVHQALIKSPYYREQYELLSMLPKGIKTFTGLTHRLEIVDTIDDVIFINDSKSTNFESLKIALEACDDHAVYLIVGGRAKSCDLSILDPVISSIYAAFIIGESIDLWAQYFKEQAVPYFVNFTLEYAVKHSFDLAQKKWTKDSQFNNHGQKNEKSVILFSPGCASFDQFNHFEHRGDVFKKLAQTMKKM